jgi:hypothetical protein
LDLLTPSQYSAIVDLRNLQFTVTQALGFAVFTRRILVTELKQFQCALRSNERSTDHKKHRSSLFVEACYHAVA